MGNFWNWPVIEGQINDFLLAGLFPNQAWVKPMSKYGCFME